MLPEKLAQRGRPAPSRFERMDWPDASISVEKRLARLRADLRGLLGEGTPDDDSAIADRLERAGVSWVFKYTVDARSWAIEDQELLARWSRFWRGLPPVRSGNAMLVFFCIPLRLPSDVGFMHRLFRGDPDQRIRLAIDRLRAEAGQCCLPLLSSIERVHVDRWADTRCPRYCPDLDLDILREEAIASYRERQAMPYGELKPDLKKALRAAMRHRIRLRNDGVMGER